MVLSVRPARADDRAAVMAISAQVWDGHDYLPEVWESWLRDPAGPMLVTLADGVVVAVCKITLQSPSEAWFAGIRVDPAYRGRGIALATTQAQLAWLAARDIPLARFTTASDNVAIHRLAGRLGFRRVAVVQHTGRPLQEGEPLPDLRTLSPDEESRAWGLFSAAPFLRATAGLYGVGWTWMRFDRTHLQGHLARGEVFGCGADPAALAIAVYRSPQTPRYVTLLAGERREALALLRALLVVRNLPVHDPAQPPSLRLPVPEGDPDPSWVAAQAGLQPQAGHQMWLFERLAGEVAR